MSKEVIKNQIAETFSEIADGILSGNFKSKVRVGLTLLGSELGVDNLLRGANEFVAENSDAEVVLIGPEVETDLELHVVSSEEEQHKKMEELLDSGSIVACVTRHYNFPIGVSTVGRVVTPSLGKEMFLATTTGTSSTNRVEAMVKNAISGIIAAKATGIKSPKVGILNVDGARQVERALLELSSNGYGIEFSSSNRADGGIVMRGNDMLQGTPDVMVTDSLTGNILQKTFSSFTTGGSFESLGSGYGPGIGDGYSRLVLILSRVSGFPVVKNALRYGVDLAQGDVFKVANEEYKSVKEAGYESVLSSLNKTKEKDTDEIKMPEEEITTGSISGIDILELEDAVMELWKNGIYAKSGMGCTGPIVMVNEAKLEMAIKVLLDASYIDESYGDGGC